MSTEKVAVHEMVTRMGLEAKRLGFSETFIWCDFIPRLRKFAIPLTEDVGEALQDYILNARPHLDCPEVFLRISPPKVALTDPASIGSMFIAYQKKAGIERKAFDGKGFHGLQRRLAKKLLITGTSLSIISQILGHDDPLTARQYLSLDVENLRECALDFRLIPVEREALL